MKRFYTLIIAVAMTAGVFVSAVAQTVTSLQLAVSTKPTDAVTDGKLAVGGTRTLVTIVEPADAKSLEVKWSVSNPDIVALDAATAGKFRGMAPGTAVVTAEVGGVTASYTVNVQQKAAKVGDYYFSNNTWEASGIVAGKTCIGVIFYVDPSDATGMTGKIVSLDETKNLKWSPDSVKQPGATSEFDGMSNLAAIKKVNEWEKKFEAEAWCTAKTDGDIQWYLPAIAELRQLFAASCGLTWVESGADESKNQINDWSEMNVTMRPADPADNTDGKINPYPTQRANFNKKFTNIGATPLNGDGTTYYWSSTEYGSSFAMRLSFEGGYPATQPRQYIFESVRAIARFPLDKGTSDIESVITDPADVAPGKLALYPNPAISTTTFDAGKAIASVDVYSMTGALTAAQASVDGTTATIDVTTLVPSTYIIVVNAADGSRLTGKLIKR